MFAVVAAAVVAGWWSMQQVPLDAIPDLSDTQVIIYSRWDRSPDSSKTRSPTPSSRPCSGAPRVSAVRGFSDFGYSFVYAIFEDGTDIYWARSRTLEYLSGVLPRCPRGSRPNRPRRHRPRLGLSVCPRRHVGAPQPRRAPVLPGLVPPLPPEVRARGGRGGARRRLRASSTRSTSTPTACRPTASPIRRSSRPSAAGTSSRRPADRVRRHRIHGPRPGLRQVDRGFRGDRPRRQRSRLADPYPGRRRGRRSGRTSAAA